MSQTARIIQQSGTTSIARMQQMAAAIGEMSERRELLEGKHFRYLPLETSGGLQKTTVLSYRGVIRTAMRSEAPRAIAYRDWAEDVLFQVMTTGSYSVSGGVHWTDHLSAQDRLRLAELRVSIALRLADDPTNAILHGAMAETYGSVGGVREYAEMKGWNDPGSSRKKARRRHSKLDRNPDIKEFVEKLLREERLTYQQISEAVSERFGRERSLSKTAVGRFNDQLRKEAAERVVHVEFTGRQAE